MRAPARPSGKGLYYFDLVAAVLAAMVASGYIVGVVARPSLSGYGPATASGLFVAALVVLGLNRSVAYTQTIPWLATLFALTAAAAVVVDFWRLDTLWLISAIGLGSLLLGFGFVVRSKTTAEGVSRIDVFKLVSIGFGVVLALVVSEGILRMSTGLFGPEIQQQLRADPSNLGVAHPYIGYLHQPNHTIVLSGRDFNAEAHVDGLGFRNRWPWPERADIVVVGDSLAFGYGVTDEQAWPAILGRDLPNARVINLSLIGAGPKQYERVYETFGVKLRPKLVLVGLFARNDFWDAEMFDKWEKSGVGGNYVVWRDFGKGGRLVIDVHHPLASVESVVSAKVYPVIRRSHLYNLARALKAGEEELGAKTFVCADGGRIQLAEGDFLAKAEGARTDRPEFQMTLDSLRRLDTLARENGARAIVVFQPGKEEVYLPLLGEKVPDITQTLRAALEKDGIDYLDLGPAFRQHAAAGERLYFEVDGHPNRAGYALIAQLVLARIQQNGGQYGLAEERVQ